MKKFKGLATANLVVAIIYTVLLMFMVVSDQSSEMTLGCIILSIPVIANYYTWSQLS
jgi:hypothetical protein